MKSITAIFFLLVATCTALSEWRRVDSGTLAWLRTIEFIDPKTGWIGGSSGTLLRTRDGGVSWRVSRIGAASTIRDILFTDARNGWLLCENDRFGARSGNPSFLMRTLDGGDTWTVAEIKVPEGRFLRMAPVGSGSAWLLGEGGIAVEVDLSTGSQSFIPLPERYLVLDAEEADNDIVLVGGGGSIFLTQDRGKSWLGGVDRSERDKLNAVEFRNSRAGMAVGNAGSMRVTTDGGRSWKRIASSFPEDLLDVRFADDRRGFAAGESGIILRTSDGGVTWVRERSGTDRRLERIARAGNRMFVVGYGGTVLECEIK